VVTFSSRNKKAALGQRKLWTFLDADASEARYYAGNGTSFGTRHINGSAGNLMAKDWFKVLERRFEEDMRVLAEISDRRSTPRVRIGILVPESKVQLLLKLREKFWSKNSG